MQNLLEIETSNILTKVYLMKTSALLKIYLCGINSIKIKKLSNYDISHIIINCSTTSYDPLQDDNNNNNTEVKILASTL